jgi:hypothetical protein
MFLFIRRALMLALLFPLVGFADVDDEQAGEAESGPATLDIAQRGGIRTQALQAAARQPELSVQGEIVDLQPLLRLRQQYFAAQADQAGASARYQAAEQNLQRTKNLHRQDIVSTRRLQEQQAQWRNDQAMLASSDYQRQTLLATARLQWGEALSRWFTQAHSPEVDDFLNHKAQLLQITLPAGRHLTDTTSSIAVDEQGRRDDAVPALFISTQPNVDPVTLGERYFFKLSQRSLPYGSRVTAWIAEGEANSEGVVIPESAIVWHLGEAFVFVETENGGFERRLMRGYRPMTGGYFAATGFEPGEVVAVAGAQTLLSSELKAMIPDDDD